MVAHEMGDQGRADREFAEALKIIRALAGAEPAKVDPKFVLAWTQDMNGRRLASDPARGPEADAAIAEALAILDKFSRDFPDETRYSGARAQALLDRADRSAASGHDDRAERDLEEARKILSELRLRKETQDRLTPIRLGQVEVALGRLRLRQGRADQAVTLLEGTSGRAAEALQERPRNRDARRLLADARAALAEAHREPKPPAGGR
jgi:hypothetical protein